MILLLGATGLLGGELLRALLHKQEPVRVFSRGSRDWKEATISDLRRRGVEVILADALDREKLNVAFAGCSGIINLIGSFKQSNGDTFQSMHVKVTETLLQLAMQNEIQRFIQVSCLGACDDSAGDCMKTKWQPRNS